MKTKRLSLTQLAAQTGRTIDEVRTALVDGGINIAEATDTLRGRHRFRARRLLGIVPKDELVVSVLAKQAGIADAKSSQFTTREEGCPSQETTKADSGRIAVCCEKGARNWQARHRTPDQIPSSELPKPKKRKKKVRREQTPWRTIGRTEEFSIPISIGCRTDPPHSSARLCDNK